MSPCVHHDGPCHAHNMDTETDVKCVSGRVANGADVRVCVCVGGPRVKVGASVGSSEGPPSLSWGLSALRLLGWAGSSALRGQ